MTVDDRTATIVGVMPPRFTLPEPAELWMPWTPDDDQRTDRFSAYIRVIGRLAPGVTLAQAQASFDAHGARLTQAFPQSNGAVRFAAVSLADVLIGNLRPLLWILLAAAGVLLVMALANVAALHLTRLGRQRHEVVVRLALGARWGQLARHLVAETLVLAICGTVLGLGVAWMGVRALVALGPEGLTRLSAIEVDWRAASVAAALALVAAVVLALPPLMRLSRDRLTTARTVVGHRWSATPRRLVVGGQLALGLLLLIGTTLLVRSFLLILSADRGYETDRRLAFTVWVYDEYPDGARRFAFVRDVIERLSALPGVEMVSMGSALPLADAITGEEADVIPEGMAVTRGQEPTARGTVVWPTYFETLGMRLVQGRAFALTDDGRAEPVVVVNEAFVRCFFPGENPLGRTVAVGLMGRATPKRIVGVVGDTRHDRLDAPPGPAVFIP